MSDLDAVLNTIYVMVFTFIIGPRLVLLFCCLPYFLVIWIDKLLNSEDDDDDDDGDLAIYKEDLVNSH